ncbi:hypothetical protein LLH06_11445 [Mucilaginibacter daejeonensis]|uniref:hypothetical protein n=1 Tax=Mucilaginibacter daejeonensis TaxID=398049 RepID=UPI001D17825A|nr:hypothetical protein [Mucilaginibacter daejeonensis]UEG51586.1 hypothetical protein LLH06_11445 [Mucilaginibacter daejeonensis]
MSLRWAVADSEMKQKAVMDNIARVKADPVAGQFIWRDVGKVLAVIGRDKVIRSIIQKYLSRGQLLSWVSNKLNTILYLSDLVTR